MLALTFITTRSPSHRLRIVLLSIAGVVVLAGCSSRALLSIDIVADLFKQRASFEQSYDLGEQGRFARYCLGAMIALDKPIGIGPLQFAKYFHRRHPQLLLERLHVRRLAGRRVLSGAGRA